MGVADLNRDDIADREMKFYFDRAGLNIVPVELVNAVRDVIHTLNGTEERHKAMDDLTEAFLRTDWPGYASPPLLKPT